MTLKALCKVMPPPPTPFENGEGKSWIDVEKAIGTPLPNDYKEYIATFGTGKIGKFILPFNPFTENEFLNLVEQLPEQLDPLRVIKEQYGNEECPYPLYPEPKGLLPWGVTDNGDVIFWSTTDNVKDWSVVIHESVGPLFEQFDESMTGFLAKLVSGGLKSNIIPRKFLNKKELFVPLA